MKLIIINGLPGTGKTTLAQPLAHTLKLPLISKDTIKEFLFDTVGTGDREWSKVLGKAASEFLYNLSDNLLRNGTSIIIETAFETSFARPVVQSWIEKYNPEVIEIYLTTDQLVRRQRFIDRNESGARHEGHADQENYLPDNDPEPFEKYAPLELGRLIQIDTTHGPIDVDRVLKEIVSY